MKLFLMRFILFPAIIILSNFLGNAQTKKADSLAQVALYKEIVHLDSVVFNAFNARDIELFKTLFTADLEFFHDKSGLTGYKHTIDFMTTTAKNKTDLKRELVRGSLEVYPIPGYGAMQIGSHKFCHTENGKAGCGTFKFVHIWQKKDGAWKISRVVSYDH